MSNQEDEILRTAKNWEVPEVRSKEEVWQTLEGKIAASDKVEVRPSNKKSFVAAAIVLISLGLMYQLFWRSTVIETQLAESKSLSLPDGTQVSLNADSRLTYKTSSFKNNRELEFEGEAFFEVKPGDSFVVHLDGLQVKVLGTSFNIYARENINEVKCLSGKVEVADKSRAVVLLPGQSISSDTGKMANTTKSFVVEKAISWREGKFHFTNAPLTRVVNELEIQYGVTVVADGLGDRFYTGYFDNANLEKALKQVFSPMGYAYEIQDNKILIK